MRRISTEHLEISGLEFRKGTAQGGAVAQAARLMGQKKTASAGLMFMVVSAAYLGPPSLGTHSLNSQKVVSADFTQSKQFVPDIFHLPDYDQDIPVRQARRLG